MCGCYDRLKIASLADGSCIQTMSGHLGRVLCVELLPDGRIISGGRDDSIKIWDFNRKRMAKLVVLRKTGNQWMMKRVGGFF